VKNSDVEQVDGLSVSIQNNDNFIRHNEALLLCEKSETEWIAWVPDHGEAILRVDQFCCLLR